ncbi:AAA family ATPase [Altererythrobacter salegens]|uniref:AAA family ATPase n=1 Tax=Croceibacterium salegens TaxID=1737568 RepID=A0A6I4T3H1_9SPHN|nr:AAA family ATPase [Croceibacterium salegens]MXO61302.1 AAA family ATPase [Croceibacterium salegens]
MLLERDDVLAELHALAAAAAEGQGKVVFVIGEAGIGKTSVLRAFAERLGDAMRPLWTACEDISSAEALTVLRDLRELGGLPVDAALDGGSRLELFRDALDRLVELPSVLFVEDLHWTDDGSIDFIRYLGRRIEGLPLLVVVTSRNEDQPARGRVVRALSDLPPTARRRVDLERLSSLAVGQLAAGHGQVGARIHDLTNGNPLLVTELLANSGVRSDSVDELVVGRASQLAPAARAFLDYCSIIPRRVSIEQIEASGAQHVDVQGCIDSGLLLQDADGLTFRHELTRNAIEAALSPLLRKQLHANELARLDSTRASAARRLHHAIHSRDRGRVAELAPVAARQASRLGAHRAAVDAWRSMIDPSDPPQDPEVCRQYAFELHVLGNLPEAIRWQERALDLYAHAGDTLKEGDSLRFLATLRYMNGERGLAEQSVQRAIDVLEPLGETGELAHAFATMAGFAMLADDSPCVAQLCAKAIPIAERLDRKDVLAAALNCHGSSLQFIDLERGLELIDRSIALARTEGIHQHVAPAAINKAWALMMVHRHEEAIEVFREGIEYSRDHDLDNWGPYMDGGIALCLLRLGRWDEAEAAAAPVIAAVDKGPVTRNPAIRAQATIAVRRGDVDSETLIAELRRHMTTGREWPRFSSLALIEAEHAWTSGEDVPAALEIVAEVLAQVPPGGSPWDAAMLWHWSRKLGGTEKAPENLPLPFAMVAKNEIDAAAKAVQELALPFEEALFLCDGDEGQAARGLAILERLGAEATARRVRAELAERGIRKGTRGPRSSTRSNDFGLTKRELEVLVHIDSGKTNKEIGEKLFVSPKTVDHHVSSILAKTGTRTRSEAAALVRREGLIG